MTSVNINANNPILISDSLANSKTSLQVHWSLAGELPISDVFAALRDIGLPEKYLPNEPNEDELLRRALLGLCEKSLIRSFKDQTKRAGKAFSIVTEDTSALDLDSGRAKEALTVTLSANIIKEQVAEGITTSKIRISSDKGNTDPRIQMIADAYSALKGKFTVSKDLSLWLSQTMMGSYFGAVTGRDRGGIYYIPPSKVAEFKRFAETMKSLSVYHSNGSLINGVKFYAIPMVNNATELSEVLIDRFREDISAQVTNITERLNDEDRKMNSAGYASQRREIQAALSRVVNFTDFLGTSHTEFKSTLEDLEGLVGMAEANYHANLKGLKAPKSAVNSSPEESDDDSSAGGVVIDL